MSFISLTCGLKLSSMTMSAPAVAASLPSSRLPHSTSILLLKPHTERASLTAWKPHSITIPLRSCLCMDTPPTSMAYFSTSRNPGVVLRVPATWPCQPASLAMLCSWEQRVAIPEARARQLRAGLSPRRTHLAGPLTTAVWATASGPGGVQLSSVKTAVKKGLPASTLHGVLHNNLASTSCDPTHNPAGSKFGVSSASHSRASRVSVWGGRVCDRSY
ncbi:hypothetical protein J4Q44_G00284960 [Coregonus suidteri]|uniref:Uncharacterized protein n=1 Tax=Coregonus suidteri TaxID=861788 RepID=A0AAN8KYG9_9TELE